MLTTIHAIALRTVKHDDRHSILTAWTLEHGRLGLLVPAGASREARRRRALLMPLSLFEAVVDLQPNRELFNFRDIKPLAILPSVAADPAKAAVALFCAEFLEKTLRDSPPDPGMTQFIFRAVERLNHLPARGVATFPVVLMTRMTAFFGIEPDVATWRPGWVLDLSAGMYRPSMPRDAIMLNPNHTAVAAIIQRLTFDTASRLALSRELRRGALDRLIQYYSLHLAALELRSLDVLRSLF